MQLEIDESLIYFFPSSPVVRVSPVRGINPKKESDNMGLLEVF